MNWWSRRLRRKQMEDQLEKELRFHLDQHATDLISGGHDSEQAPRTARLALGVVDGGAIGEFYTGPASEPGGSGEDAAEFKSISAARCRAA